MRAKQPAGGSWATGSPPAGGKQARCRFKTKQGRHRKPETLADLSEVIRRSIPSSRPNNRSPINNNASAHSDHTGKGTRNSCRADQGFPRVAGCAHARRRELRDGVAGCERMPMARQSTSRQGARRKDISGFRRSCGRKSRPRLPRTRRRPRRNLQEKSE